MISLMRALPKEISMMKSDLHKTRAIAINIWGERQMCGNNMEETIKLLKDISCKIDRIIYKLLVKTPSYIEKNPANLISGGYE